MKRQAGLSREFRAGRRPNLTAEQRHEAWIKLQEAWDRIDEKMAAKDPGYRGRLEEQQKMYRPRYIKEPGKPEAPEP
jgi:hypothetical protein